MSIACESNSVSSLVGVLVVRHYMRNLDPSDSPLPLLLLHQPRQTAEGAGMLGLHLTLLKVIRLHDGGRLKVLPIP
eukprot:276563-Amphidinium_carterae.1